MRKSLGAVLIAGTATLYGLPAAFAGEQYVGANGYALSGYDAVAYFTDGGPVEGSEAYSYDYNGATWLFASAEHRDQFAADPQAYAPVYDGHCAFGAAQDYKVPGDPLQWRVVDGHLYVNVSPRAQELFLQDVPGTISRADANWPALEPAPAADPQ
ncbi:MAG: YHS domain-containing protein [Rhodospirillaceae bacterium]|nr:YHS domain-containing protein [Rhodospirillaceae bacterium]